MSEIVLCKDCRNFRKDTFSDILLAGSFTKFRGICTLATSNDGEAEDGETNAYAADIEENHAVLRVAENYGCVQGVAKGGSE